MQIHPDDPSFAEEHVCSILEHNQIIGLGDWEGGERNGTIHAFKNEMQVNDVVAIKIGAKLIALIQVTGGAYHADDEIPETGWIVHRRPIRVLDWEIEEKYLPQPMGTLNKCVNDVETTRIIKLWHERVIKSLKRRKVRMKV